MNGALFICLMDCSCPMNSVPGVSQKKKKKKKPDVDAYDANTNQTDTKLSLWTVTQYFNGLNVWCYVRVRERESIPADNMAAGGIGDTAIKRHFLNLWPIQIVHCMDLHWNSSTSPKSSLCYVKLVLWSVITTKNKIYK